VGTTLVGALQHVGADLSHVVALRLYIKQSHITQGAAISSGLHEVFGEALPCATWIGVSSLAHPDFSVQFTLDQHGKTTAVVLTPELWARLLEALEDAEDRALVRALRERLAAGPVASGALHWEDAEKDWA
jgi:hypothetical protein